MSGPVPPLLCMSSWHAFGQLYFYSGIVVISIHLFPPYLSFVCAINSGGTLHYECVTVFQDVVIITLQQRNTRTENCGKELKLLYPSKCYLCVEIFSFS
jgi:hypothetical protein